MVYDPQRDRPRPRPDRREASVVDSLLDRAADPAPHDAHEPTPAPSLGATTEPAGALSDRLLYSAGISTVMGAAVALLTLRWLWKFWKRRIRSR